MRLRPLLTLVVTLAFGISPQAGAVSTSQSPSQQPSVTSQQPSATSTSPMTISGTVVQMDGGTNRPVPGARVRLRRVDDGAIGSETVADATGAFSLPVRDSGVYVVEVFGENGEVLAVSNPVSTATGRVTATVVLRSSHRLPGGIFRGVALGVLSVASGAGITAAVLGGSVQPVSPER